MRASSRGAGRHAGWGWAGARAKRPDRRSAYGQTVDLAEFFAEVHIVEAVIGRGHELLDVRPQRRRQLTRRGPSPRAVHQAVDALGAEALLKPLELPRGHRQRVGALFI